MTRQQAINAFCKDCIYDSADGGTWREQVKACTSQDCPLFEHRPVPVVRNPNPGPVPAGIARFRKQKQE